MTGTENRNTERTEKLYPVYTWHAEELAKLHGITAGIIARHEGEPETEKMAAIRRLCTRLEQVAEILLTAFGDVAYLNGRDLELVRKTADWLQAHPETPEG